MEFMDDVIPHPSFFNYHTYSTLTHTRPLGLGKTQTIEYSLIEKDIIAGLQKGNDVLKQIHLEMNVDTVSKLMDDTADAIAYQNEINDIMSGTLSEGDLEDCEKELELLLKEEVNIA